MTEPGTVGQIRRAILGLFRQNSSVHLKSDFQSTNYGVEFRGWQWLRFGWSMIKLSIGEYFLGQ
jgi:hypothetical protein